MEFSKEELQVIINVIGQAQVKVVEAPYFIEIINKASKMIDRTSKKK